MFMIDVFVYNRKILSPVLATLSIVLYFNYTIAVSASGVIPVTPVSITSSVGNREIVLKQMQHKDYAFVHFQPTSNKTGNIINETVQTREENSQNVVSKSVFTNNLAICFGIGSQ